MSEAVVMERRDTAPVSTPPCLQCAENECDTMEDVTRRIICRLQAFDEAIAKSECLEIDGLSVDSKPCDKVTAQSRIKVLNKSMEAAFEVDVDTIIRTPLEDLLLALTTGIMQRLDGITRIVGYYSRIANWNSSKTAELADRRKGNYWEDKRINSEKINLLHE